MQATPQERTLEISCLHFISLLYLKGNKFIRSTPKSRLFLVLFSLKKKKGKKEFKSRFDWRSKGTGVMRALDTRGEGKRSEDTGHRLDSIQGKL